jgi:hypothetical protein
MSGTVRVFYSYAHRDEDCKDRLLTHLKLLERKGIIRGWHDRLITGGKEWKGEIDANLEDADVVLLLVSADFLASDYCYDVEMKRALERHNAGQACVVPIILQPCLWEHAPFATLQVLPKDGRPISTYDVAEQAWAEVADGIARAVVELRHDEHRHIAPFCPRRIIIRAKAVPNEMHCVFGERADIGRSVLCDFSFPLAPGQVSNKHALLTFDQKHGQFIIRDLGSSNGTYVDGKRVTTEAVLADGSGVNLSHSLDFLFRFEPRDPSIGGSLLFHDKNGREVGCYAIAPSGRIRIGNAREDMGRLPFLAAGFTLGTVVQRGGSLRLIWWDTSDTPKQDVRLVDGMELALTAHSLSISVT